MKDVFLLFAILCPLLVWPLARRLRLRGFNPTTYIICSLAGFIAGLVGGWFVAYWTQLLLVPYFSGLVGILLVHLGFETVAGSMDPKDLARWCSMRDAEEQRLRARQEALNDQLSTWLPLKTYNASSQQHEYLRDRDRLDAARIRYTVSAAGLTTVLVHPDQAEAAGEVLGITLSETGPEPAASGSEANTGRPA